MATVCVENARSLISIVEQRRQHLSSNIHNLNWLAITVVVGIWSFFLTRFLEHSPFVNPNITVDQVEPFAFSYIMVAAGISSFILVLWRIYAKYLDYHISIIYPEIMKYEKCLDVSEADGITNYLTESNSVLKRTLPTLCGIQQIELVKQLVRDRHIGRRGHLVVDWLVVSAVVIFVCLIVTDFYFLNEYGQLEELIKFDDISRIPIITSKLFGYLAIVSSLVIHIIFMFVKFQRNPKDKHVNKIVTDLKTAEQK